MMYKNAASRHCSPARGRLVLLHIGLLLIMGVSLLVLNTVLPGPDRPAQGNLPPLADYAVTAGSTVPLLIGSGLTAGQQAEASIIIFFDQDVTPSTLEKVLPTGWAWQAVRQTNGHGATALTMSARRTIEAGQEAQTLLTYRKLVAPIQAAGGHTYFEERVAEVVDPVRYLVMTGAVPAEIAASGPLLSIAAWQRSAGTTVTAGPDQINVQIAVRSGTTGGQTVLAMPALLQEF